MSKYKVIDTFWIHSTRLRGDKSLSVGVVATETNGGWRAYVGLSTSKEEIEDEQKVAALGQKLLADQAHGFFPKFDIKKYDL